MCKSHNGNSAGGNRGGWKEGEGRWGGNQRLILGLRQEDKMKWSVISRWQCVI